MTLEELNSLELRAKDRKDVESLIELGELYLKDYALLRSRYTVYLIFNQYIKVFWKVISATFPDISANKKICDTVKDCNAEPTLQKIRELLVLTIDATKNRDFLERQKCSGAIQKSFIILSDQIVEITNRNFGHYANTRQCREIIEPFVNDPSFTSLVETVKRFGVFGKGMVDIEATEDCVVQLLDRYDDIEAHPLHNELIPRLSKIASETERTPQFLFTQCKWRSEQGDAEAMVALGNMYEYGKGTDIDEDNAEYWYNRGQAMGSNSAEQALLNLHDKQQTRIDRQIREEYMRHQADIERQESLERIAIERENAEENARHNREMEEMRQREMSAVIEANEAITRANMPPEEKMIEVLFSYSYTWGKNVCDGNFIKKITQSTYNSLISGGSRAIVSYVEGVKNYPQDGENILHATMSEL